MRFPLQLSKKYFILKIVMILSIVLSIAMIVLSIITLCGAYTFLNMTFAQAKIQIATACISILMMSALLSLHYHVDDKHLRIKLLFFDLLGGRIRHENILNIVYTEGLMYISYIWKGADPVIAGILIAPSKYDKMKEALLAKNKNIVFFEDKDETGDSEQ
ncbi:MAG: hypothetical protein IKA29_05670 [Clostridia bacterium]|nr:hypothetical protein [Clostridia bacterium]